MRLWDETVQIFFIRCQNLKVKKIVANSSCTIAQQSHNGKGIKVWDSLPLSLLLSPSSSTVQGHGVRLLIAQKKKNQHKHWESSQGQVSYL